MNILEVDADQQFLLHTPVKAWLALVATSVRNGNTFLDIGKEVGTQSKLWNMNMWGKQECDQATNRSSVKQTFIK